MTRAPTSNGVPHPIAADPGGMNHKTTVLAAKALRELVAFHYPDAAPEALAATTRLLALRVADYLGGE